MSLWERLTTHIFRRQADEPFFIWLEEQMEIIKDSFSEQERYAGDGSPEGVVEAPVGALYQRWDGGAGTTLYVKESGSGNTGWVAK